MESLTPRQYHNFPSQLPRQSNLEQNVLYQQQHSSGNSLRLKCVVLGSAGAGKTSILRRYCHNRFEYGRNSTIGADFYSKRVLNPFYKSAANKNDIESEHKHTSAERRLKKKAKKKQKKSDIDYEERKQNKTDRKDNKNQSIGYKKKLVKESAMTESNALHLNSNSVGDASAIESDQSNVWAPTIKDQDLEHITNGKKEILKTPKLKGKDKSISTISPTPVETYTKWRRDITNQQYIGLQMWDTAGLERFVSNTSFGLTSSLGSSFLRHADVAMLVYDATSSRSFTQLIKWYSELMEKMNDLMDLKVDTDGGASTRSAFDAVYRSSNDKLDCKSRRIRLKRQRFPVVIVANKLDKLKVEISKPIRRQTVPQRDVLGMTNKQFKGKDSRYEYTVSTSPGDVYFSSPTTEKHMSLVARSGGSGTGTNRSIKDAKSGNTTTRLNSNTTLSYGLEGASWTSDQNYLTSVINSEDGSLPDRDMVLLWCRRNGLSHVDVSALDGTGIDAAVESVLKIALEILNDNRNLDMELGLINRAQQVPKQTQLFDFHERYKSNEKCKMFKCLWPFC